MWIFTSTGFCSIVSHRSKPGHLLVRARVRDDLRAFLRDAGSFAPIVEMSDADYRYRATVTKDEGSRALLAAVTRLDYDNFKCAVAARQGGRRAELYHNVWEDLLPLQR